MLKNLNVLISITIFHFILIISSVSADDSQSKERIKIGSHEDLILWAGLDFPDEFDSGTMESLERKKALEEGLEYFEYMATNIGSASSMGTLATYHFYFKNDTKKGLYWAYKGAEKGEGCAMHVLACAYISGDGVIQDTIEAFKWILLAAACGDEGAKEKFNGLNKKYTNSECLKSAKAKAREWQEAHPDAFFSP